MITSDFKDFQRSTQKLIEGGLAECDDPGSLLEDGDRFVECESESDVLRWNPLSPLVFNLLWAVVWYEMIWFFGDNYVQNRGVSSAQQQF